MKHFLSKINQTMFSSLNLVRQIQIGDYLTKFTKYNICLLLMILTSSFLSGQVNNDYAITVRARGKAGSENINLKIGGTTIASWTLSTSYQNYSATTSLGGAIKVDYTNDNGSIRDAYIDYIVVDGNTLQAEDQEINTGAWDGSCGGGSYTESMHCNGYIEFDSYDRDVNLNVMSFNILYENAPPPNNWDSERKTMVRDVILAEAPDLMGLQEVQLGQLTDLQNLLSAKYTTIMPWNNTFFGNAIGYLTTRFTLVESGSFSYSNTPDIVKTDFHTNNDARYASWAILTDNQTSKNVFIISTHFYSPSGYTDERYWSSQILMARIQKLAQGLPIVAVGDFNQQQEHESYNEITGYHVNPLTDTYRSLNVRDKTIEGTVHNGLNEFPAPIGGWRIDYIFSANMNILDSKIIRTNYNQKYPSDHFPLTTDFSYGAIPIPTPDPNIINPGGILGGKDFASSSFPAQTLSSALAAYGGCTSGTIQYQWQNRVREACSETWGAWSNMASATNLTSSWPSDTQDIQFRRGAKRSGCGTWQYSNIITMDITRPVTNPGEISGNVISCGITNPDPLISISEASGGCGGELQYMWQSRDKAPCDTTWSNWNNYTNQTELTFDPGEWFRDREMRRGARRIGGTDWVFSNIVSIEMNDPNSSDANCKCDGDIYAIDLRIKGSLGNEVIDLSVGGTIINSLVLSTAYEDYTTQTNLIGAIKVELRDGAGPKDAQLDYIVVDGTNTWQAEDQEINTAAWNGTCGAGSYTEMMHCSGYIEFDSYLHTITLRAKGRDGTENINLQVGGTTITSWTLSENYQDYTVTTNLGGSIKVDYDNDIGNIRDAYIDYIVVDGTTLQAEDQVTNTGVYQNSSCGGSYSETMHCSGYIEFASAISAKSQNTKNTSLNLNETEPNYEISLYPNPINNVLTIQLFDLFEKEIPISVYNVNGSVVKRIFINDKINEINLSELQSGIYFVKVNLNNKMVVKKIIKL